MRATTPLLTLSLLALVLLAPVSGAQRLAAEEIGQRPALPEESSRQALIAKDIAEEKARAEYRRTAYTHLDRGEALLAELKPEPAITEFQRVIELCKNTPPAVAPSTVLAGFAAEGIAWAYLLQGGFQQAAHWLESSVYDYPDFCGVYDQYRRSEVKVVSRVWLTAALQPGEAEPMLRRFAAGKLPWGAAPLDKNPTMNRALLKAASRQASFLLGVQLLQRRQKASARYFLRKAVAPPQAPGNLRNLLATSYLKQATAAGHDQPRLSATQ